MKKYLVIAFAVVLAFVSLMSLAGCISYNRVAGSKNIETRAFDYSGFNRIEVGDAFDVTITRSYSYQVSVTLNDNLFNDLDISVSGDTLRIRMKSFLGLRDTTQRATITLPEVRAILISGASRAVVTGFQSDTFLKLEVSGASRMEINDLKAADTDIQVSGVGRLSGSLVTIVGDFEISGVSNVELNGSGTTVRVEVIGASSAILPKFIIRDASFKVSGASTADVEVVGRLDIDLSGASRLTYGDSPSLGRVGVSGASTLNRR
jgi:hypothetical protein